jgi:osmotically-inducible protein OsmY
MSKSKCFMLTSVVFLFGGALSAYADNETSSVGVSQDTQITEAVKQAIAQHSDLKAPNQIYVDTRDHVVYLSGVVENSLATENAEQVARQVAGVVRVVNTIAVDK